MVVVLTKLPLEPINSEPIVQVMNQSIKKLLNKTMININIILLEKMINILWLKKN